MGHLLDRDFRAKAPNQKWLVDITAIDTDEGSLYLAGVLDWFSRRRSVRGSHYTRDEYQARLARYPLVASFSGVGGCYDQAPMLLDE